MKRLFACVSLLVSVAASAGEVFLQPYFPSPIPNAPFSEAPDCHVQSIDATGATSGVCRYYNYCSGRGCVAPSGLAIVTWDPTGTPQGATLCYAYSYQGSPVCPAQTFGPLEEISPGVYVFVQGTAAGVTAAITDATPRESVIFTQ